MAKRLELPRKIQRILENLPVSGMGYHLVSVFLKNGEYRLGLVILNCQWLTYMGGQCELDFSVNDIKKMFVAVELHF